MSPDTRLAALELDLASWKNHDFERSMSDDFWYSNGGHAAAEAEMRKIEKQIAELKAVHA